MSTYVKPQSQTYLATAAIVEYTFVKLDSDTNVSTAVTGQRPCGIAMNNAGIGEPVEVAMFGGGAKLKLAGAVTIGKFLMPNASGQGVYSGANTLAFAFSTSGGAVGDVISVEVAPAFTLAAET